MPKPPQKHHWVPQCYLRNFQADDRHDQVYMYRKNLPPIVVGIANIAAENDLYSFTDKTTGEKSVEIEKIFGVLESATAPVLEKIIRDEALSLNSDEIGALAQFAAFLAVRGPSFSDWQRNMSAEGYKIFSRAMAEDPEILKHKLKELDISYKTEKEFEQLRSILFEGALEITGGKASFFTEAIELGMEMTDMLVVKSWHLLRSDSSRVFITSDNPVVIQSNTEVPFHVADGYLYGTLLIPISPRLCLVMRALPLDREVIDIGGKWVDYVNRSVMKTAHRHIYSNLSSRLVQASYDEFAAGVESRVSSHAIPNTPYIVVQGIERDKELSILSSYTDTKLLEKLEREALAKDQN